MLQFFGILAFLATWAQTPPKAIEFTADNGKVIVQSGDAHFRAQKLTYEAKIPGRIADLEFHAEGNLIIVEVKGLKIQAAEMHYRPNGYLVCKGDPDNKAQLWVGGGRHAWQLEQEAKEIAYFIGGSFGYED
jgi:hypothetical protein